MGAKLQRLGAGPKWALPVGVYFAAALAVHLASYPRMVMRWLPAPVGAAAGAVLIAAGCCTYAAAMVTLRRAWRRGTLATSGLYGLVRHPLYASALLLVIPGVVLAVRSWLLVPMPAVAYAAFRWAVRTEEQELHRRYGEAYERYRKSTNAIFPRLAGRNSKTYEQE
ncbi:MAG: isoprenylcysteine carboxylmethyltransferase family protein [Planctomycetes bacterium]|nr:isoprenylcysteine carboxylmethyltransferase family protein [Planctomycetota bacterium]